MNYRLIWTPLGQTDLRELRWYITNNLYNSTAADKIYNEIVKRAKDLTYDPYIYRLYEFEPYRSMGLRLFYVKKYIIYYMVDEALKTVSIVRIANGRQSDENRMKGI